MQNNHFGASAAAAAVNDRPLVCQVREAGLAAVAAELRLDMRSLPSETAKGVTRGAAGLFFARYGARSNKTAALRRLKR